MRDLVAGRFVSMAAANWLDLATGARAAIEIGAIADPAEAERAAAEAFATGRDPALVDWGPIGGDAWFVARTLAAAGWPRTGLADCGGAIDRVAAVVDAPHQAGIRVIRVPGVIVQAGPAAVSVLARRLRAAGFALVCPEYATRAGRDAALSHRHLAVLLVREETRDDAIAWLRRLTRASLRAHVILDGRADPPLVARASVVRERPPAYAAAAPAPARASPIERRFSRAIASARRGRIGDAGRWARAAVEAPARSEDDVIDPRRAATLVAMLGAAGRWTDGARFALRAADRVRRFDDRMTHVGTAAVALMHEASFEQAAHELMSVRAEARLRRVPLGPSLRVALAQLCAWQGRVAAAWRWIAEETPPEPDAIAWRRTIARQVGAGNGGPAAASDSERPTAGEARGLPSVLAAAMEADEWLARGQPARAIEAIDRVAGRRRSPLEALLVEWLVVVARGDSAGRAEVTRRARRQGAPGIVRWGMGDTDRQILGALPDLLERLGHAEDEQAALSLACRWTMQQPGVTGAAIVCATTSRVLAREGRTGAERAASAARGDGPGRQPRVIVESGRAAASGTVRYGGQVIAHLVVEGGAADVELIALVARTVAPAVSTAARARLDAMAAASTGAAATPEILGTGPAIGAVRDAIVRAAPTSFAVLVEGESGTGKELVARAVHRLSARRDRRFCAVNCAALTDELIEAELFGHARGAFTGAIGARAGLFEEADRGTLFLDEVADLSPRAQAKLLRAIQEREIRRLGENAPRQVDVRIIAATNRPLAQAAASGLFREDLVFRLAVVRIPVPALRHRVEDIPALAQKFWKPAASDARTRALLGPDALTALCRHTWPGNVRELQNVIAALALIAPDRGRVGARQVAHVLGIAAAPDEVRPLPLEQARRECERRTIAAALARHQGGRAAAARDLGLTRQGLLKAMRRVGLASGDAAAAGVA